MSKRAWALVCAVCLFLLAGCGPMRGKIDDNTARIEALEKYSRLQADKILWFEELLVQKGIIEKEQETKKED